MLTIYLHILARLRMSGAIPLLSMCDFTAWRGTASQKTRRMYATNTNKIYLQSYEKTVIGVHILETSE